MAIFDNPDTNMVVIEIVSGYPSYTRIYKINVLGVSGNVIPVQFILDSCFVRFVPDQGVEKISLPINYSIFYKSDRDEHIEMSLEENGILKIAKFDVGDKDEETGVRSGKPVLALSFMYNGQVYSFGDIELNTRCELDTNIIYILGK